MYYIMLKFPFLYVGLTKTIKDIFELVGEKKICPGKKLGKTREFQIAWSIDTLYSVMRKIPKNKFPSQSKITVNKKV